MSLLHDIRGLTSEQHAVAMAALAALVGSESKAVVEKPTETPAKPKRKRKANMTAKKAAEADGAIEAVAEKPAEKPAETKASKPSSKPKNDDFEHGELEDALYLAHTKAIPGKRKGKTTAIAIMGEGEGSKGPWVRFMRLGINTKGVYLWSIKTFNGKMKFLSPDEITDIEKPTVDNAELLVELEDRE